MADIIRPEAVERERNLYCRANYLKKRSSKSFASIQFRISFKFIWYAKLPQTHLVFSGIIFSSLRQYVHSFFLKLSGKVYYSEQSWWFGGGVGWGVGGNFTPWQPRSIQGDGCACVPPPRFSSLLLTDGFSSDLAYSPCPPAIATSPAPAHPAPPAPPAPGCSSCLAFLLPLPLKLFCSILCQAFPLCWPLLWMPSEQCSL